VEIFGRLRFAAIIWLRIKKWITGRKYHLAPRSRFSTGVYGSRYEMAYLPVLFLIYLRLTGTVIYMQPGNHLDKDGTPDSAFVLPPWTYFCFFLAEFLADIGTFCLSKIGQLGQVIRTFRVSHWYISFVGIFTGFTVTLVNVLSTGLIFFDYNVQA